LTGSSGKPRRCARYTPLRPCRAGTPRRDPRAVPRTQSERLLCQREQVVGGCAESLDFIGLERETGLEPATLWWDSLSPAERQAVSNRLDADTAKCTKFYGLRLTMVSFSSPALRKGQLSRRVFPKYPYTYATSLDRAEGRFCEWR